MANIIIITGARKINRPSSVTQSQHAPTSNGAAASKGKRRRAEDETEASGDGVYSPPSQYTPPASPPSSHDEDEPAPPSPRPLAHDSAHTPRGRPGRKKRGRVSSVDGDDDHSDSETSQSRVISSDSKAAGSEGRGLSLSDRADALLARLRDHAPLNSDLLDSDLAENPNHATPNSPKPSSERPQRHQLSHLHVLSRPPAGPHVSVTSSEGERVYLRLKDAGVGGKSGSGRGRSQTPTRVWKQLLSVPFAELKSSVLEEVSGRECTTRPEGVLIVKGVLIIRGLLIIRGVLIIRCVLIIKRCPDY